jgi:hypothetical protein
MDSLIPYFAILGFLAAILANIALWSPRRLRVKLAALAVTAVFLPAGYYGLTEMLSRPKPVDFEWARRSVPEATVLGSHMVEGKAIYLWLGLPDTATPRAYVLPWSEQAARQLHAAGRLAEEAGTEVQMREPFENSLDRREQVFYAPPQPPAPAKEIPGDAPLQFQQSQTPDDPDTN